MKVNTPSPLPPIEALFGQRLGIVTQQYSGLIVRLLEPHDLTWPQFALLVHLSRASGPSRVSDMVRALDLTQSAITKMVQKFANLGLVEVARDLNDARNRPVSITAQGRAHVGAVQRSFGPAFAVLTGGWDPDRLAGLLRDLEELSRRLESLRDTSTGPGDTTR